MSGSNFFIKTQFCGRNENVFVADKRYSVRQ